MIGMALVAVILFFVSLVLHELGHALVARREGITIDGITLWLFGGVARFHSMFPSAAAEFRIAVAGPVVSAVLGVFFVAFAALTHLTPAVDGVAAWLGYINLLLLGFNLLPALPLDEAAEADRAKRVGEQFATVTIYGRLLVVYTRVELAGRCHPERN
jgi:Zn-dependent protease